MISEAVSAQEEAAEAELRVQWERQQHPRWMAATDDVLFGLEDLNLEGVKRVPKIVREWVAGRLSEMPLEAQEVLKLYPGVTVQAALDSVFLAQEALFCLRDPARATDVEELQATDVEVYRQTIRRGVRQHPMATRNRIAEWFPFDQRTQVRALVVRMAEAGELVLATAGERRGYVLGEGWDG